jgi:hypothetical protein
MAQPKAARARTLTLVAILVVVVAVVIALVMVLRPGAAGSGSGGGIRGGAAPDAQGDAQRGDPIAAFNDLARSLRRPGTEPDPSRFERLAAATIRANDRASGASVTGADGLVRLPNAPFEPSATPEDRAFGQAIIAQLEAEGVFTLLDDLAREPWAPRVVNDADGLTALTADGAVARHLTRVLTVRAQAAASAGDGAGLAIELRRVAGLAGALASTPSAHSSLVASAVAARAAEIAIEALAARDWSDADLVLVRDALESIVLPDPVAMLRGERLVVVARSNAGGASLSRAWSDSAEHFDPIIEAMGMPRAERRARLAAIATSMSSARARGSAAGVDAGIALRTLGAVEQARVRRDGAIVAIAAARFRIAAPQGTPITPEALVPAFLARIPDDPFGDGPLRIREANPEEHAANPALARQRIVVYTVGHDGADNGGMPAPNAIDALNGSTPGADFIVNVP